MFPRSLSWWSNLLLHSPSRSDKNRSASFWASNSNLFRNLFVKSVSCVSMSSRSYSFCFLEAFSSWISLCIFLHSASMSATICFSLAILVLFSLTMPSVIPFSWARIGFKWSSWYFILSCSSCLIAFSNSSLWQFQIYCGGYLHSLVIVFPLFAEDLAFLLDLGLDVITQLLQPLLELFLESVEGCMDVVHGFDCLLPILLDLTRLDRWLW